jgi:hypothetical protein
MLRTSVPHRGADEYGWIPARQGLLWQKLMDDVEVVNAGVIEERPIMAAEEQASAPPAAATAAAQTQPRMWSMPTLEATRKHTDEFGRIAIKVGASVAAFARRVGTVCGRMATFGWQLLREVPPALQLLGALGLLTVLSIVGSVTLDSAFGRTCAVVFVPVFALAFGVIAHRSYGSTGGDRGPRKDVQKNVPSSTNPTADLARSIEYVDSKLAFALNALGTDRQQQAAIALIQAKTATELSFGTVHDSVEPGLRPRIKDGGASKTFAPEGISGGARS